MSYHLVIVMNNSIMLKKKKTATLQDITKLNPRTNCSNSRPENFVMTKNCDRCECVNIFSQRPKDTDNSFTKVC